jgi:hypothetical protein
MPPTLVAFSRIDGGEMWKRMKAGSLIRPGLILAGIVEILLTACGGSGASGGTGNQGGIDPGPVTVATPGTAVIKVRATDNTWVALAETLQRIDNVVRPERRLLIASDGVRPGSTYLPPAGWSLIDFTLHRSREISLVLATDSSIRLVRLDAQGRVLASEDFTDPLVATDPFLGDPLQIRDSHSMVPRNTRDAARLGTAGEDAVLVLRTGRNAVLAYRLAFATNTGFRRAWRTLVEPGVYIGNVGLTSGTIDPFGGLDNQWRVAMDVDANGRVAIAVGTLRTELAEGHASYFNEHYFDNPYGVVLVTQLETGGNRAGTAAIELLKKSEVHAVKWAGDAVAVGGRTMSESRPDGSGWDACLTIVHPAQGGSKPVAVIDIDRGDVILEIAQTASGQLMVGGSSGYIQNPAGASISEEATPLLALLDAQGKLIRRVSFGTGPRYSQLRALAPFKNGWLAGGFENGPGTHSADANPALLFADGYIRAVNPSVN